MTRHYAILCGALLFGCVGGSDEPSGPPPGAFWTECTDDACAFHEVGLVYECEFANTAWGNDTSRIDYLRTVCAWPTRGYGDGPVLSVSEIEMTLGEVVCEHNGTEWKPGCTYECVDTGRRCETVDGEVVW